VETGGEIMNYKQPEPEQPQAGWVTIMEYRHIRNKQLEKAKREYFEARQ
jgi:hypothetical protein